jgi:F0F1-type ATP synthase assembly protein I
MTQPFKPPIQKYNTVLKYSGMAFELLAFILIGYWVGNKADQYFQNTKPILAVFGIIFMTAAALYRVIRSVEQDNKKK